MNWVEKDGKVEEKQTIWALFGVMYRYTLNMYRYMLGSGHFGSTCTGTCQGCTGTCDAQFPVSTSFRILTINCSFLIRFEWFKLLVQLYGKENQIYRNRHRQIRTLSGPKIHSN